MPCFSSNFYYPHGLNSVLLYHFTVPGWTRTTFKVRDILGSEKLIGMPTQTKWNQCQIAQPHTTHGKESRCEVTFLLYYKSGLLQLFNSVDCFLTGSHMDHISSQPMRKVSIVLSFIFQRTTLPRRKTCARRNICVVLIGSRKLFTLQRSKLLWPFSNFCNQAQWLHVARPWNGSLGITFENNVNCSPICTFHLKLNEA